MYTDLDMHEEHRDDYHKHQVQQQSRYDSVPAHGRLDNDMPRKHPHWERQKKVWMLNADVTIYIADDAPTCFISKYRRKPTFQYVRCMYVYGKVVADSHSAEPETALIWR